MVAPGVPVPTSRCHPSASYRRNGAGEREGGWLGGALAHSGEAQVTKFETSISVVGTSFLPPTQHLPPAGLISGLQSRTGAGGARLGRQPLQTSPALLGCS